MFHDLGTFYYWPVILLNACQFASADIPLIFPLRLCITGKDAMEVTGDRASSALCQWAQDVTRCYWDVNLNYLVEIVSAMVIKLKSLCLPLYLLHILEKIL